MNLFLFTILIYLFIGFLIWQFLINICPIKEQKKYIRSFKFGRFIIFMWFFVLLSGIFRKD